VIGRGEPLPLERGEVTPEKEVKLKRKGGVNPLQK